MNDKLQLLSSLNLFQDLNAKELASLENVTTVSQVRKGRMFYRAEERGDSVFMLRKGLVQVYRISPGGKKLIINRLNGGSLFGEMALLGNQIHHTFAEATDECTVVVMNRRDLEHLIMINPQVGLRLIEITGRRLKETERRLEDLAFKSITARIAASLLRLDIGETGEVVGVTHQELAEMVGTYRETTTQLLGELKEAQIINTGHRLIKILDRERLKIAATSINKQVSNHAR